MTITRSASGIRIDCDHCEHHTGARALTVDELRRAAGYISHRDNDLCPTCGSSLVRYPGLGNLPLLEDPATPSPTPARASELRP